MTITHFIEEFIPILNNKKEYTDIHIVTDNENYMFISEGKLSYIGIDKEKKDFIRIAYGTNQLYIRISNIKEISQEYNYYIINVANMYFDNIKFKISQ